jgi:drug/metabolite transporter (DMT)-like permease
MSDRAGRVMATLIGAIGVVLWATETSLVTYTTAIPPLETVAIAFVFAAALSPFVWLVTGASPLVAFKQPPAVWFLTVGSLVSYHACIYYATQRAPPAAAALLQGTTPLMIVIGSALLPGERLRWWHIAGVVMGLAGVLRLINAGDGAGAADGAFYLALIGIAAALWGIYSILSRALPEVPSSALGMFYAVSAVMAFAAHVGLENWVQPTPVTWLALAALGIFPMGLAIYFWDFGLKRGDIQALGAFSYVEPFIGAVLVALFANGALELSLFWSGLLVVGGAAFASASLWMPKKVDLSIADQTLHNAGISFDLVAMDLTSQLERPVTIDLNSSELRRCLRVFQERVDDLRQTYAS